MDDMEDTPSFIKRLKLPEKYADTLLENGYEWVSDLIGIDGDELKDIGISLPGHRRRIMNSLRQVLPSKPRTTELKPNPEKEPVQQSPEDVYSYSGYYQQPSETALPNQTSDEAYNECQLGRVDSMFGTISYGADRTNRTHDISPDFGYDSLNRTQQIESKNATLNKIDTRKPLPNANFSMDQFSVYDTPSNLKSHPQESVEDIYQHPIEHCNRSQSAVELRLQSEDTASIKPSQSGTNHDSLLHPDGFYQTFHSSYSEPELDHKQGNTDELAQHGYDSFTRDQPKPVPRKRTITPPDPAKISGDTSSISVLQDSVTSQSDTDAPKAPFHSYENVPRLKSIDSENTHSNKSDYDVTKEETTESVYESYFPNLKYKSDAVQQNENSRSTSSTPRQSSPSIFDHNKQFWQESYDNDISSIEESPDFGVYKKLQAPGAMITNHLERDKQSYTCEDDEYNLLERSPLKPVQTNPSVSQITLIKDTSSHQPQEDDYNFLDGSLFLKQNLPEQSKDSSTYCQGDDEYNLLDRAPQTPQALSQDERSPESTYDYPPSFPSPIDSNSTPPEGVYNIAPFPERVAEPRSTEDEYEDPHDLGMNGLMIQQKNSKQVTLQDSDQDNEYEDTSFAASVLSKPELPTGRPVSPRGRITRNDQIPSAKLPEPPSQTESENRVSRSRAGGISFYGGFSKDTDFKPRQRIRRMLRSGREKKQDRPVSVCMQSLPESLPAAEERSRTYSSTLNRQQYSLASIAKNSDKNPEAYERLVKSLDHQPMIPVSPLKKTRTKSGWLWKQPVSESKVPPRKRWAVFNGEELIYYTSDSKLEFSKGILPIKMMLKLDIPTDSQTSFHLLMKGGKTFIFQSESKEERIIWTSTIMAAILTYQKEPSHQSSPGGDMSPPYKEGSLKMDRIKQKVYVALKQDTAAYYKSKQDFMFAQPVTRMKMKYATMRDVGRFKFQLVFSSRVFGFAAENDQEKISWMEAFQMAISGRLSNQEIDGNSKIPIRQSTSLRDHLFKYGGDFKVAHDTGNRKMRQKLQMIKSALQTGDFQKRLCTLECSVLSYCDSEKPFAVKDSFSCSELLSVTVNTPDVATKSGFQHSFELSRKSGRTYLFCADNKETMLRWTTGVAREILPDHIQDVLSIEEFDKIGKVKLKMEPLSVLDSVWKEAWCRLYKKKLHIYYEATQKMDALDLRRMTELAVSKTQDPTPFDYSSLAPPREANHSIVIALRDKFYFIQSETKADTDSWLSAIKRADNGSGPTLEDMQLTIDGIPIIVQKCLSYVERHGMDTRGIYRLSGTHSKTTQLLTNFLNNARETQMVEHINVHDVSNTLKRWCKSLPGSILTSPLYAKWIEVAGSNQSTADSKLERYKHLVKILPERHRLTLKAILQHLVRISTFEQENDMTLHNLAIVFGPTLMGLDEKDGGGKSFVGDTAKQIGCIEDLLVNFDALFEAPESDHSWSDKSSRDGLSTDSDHDEDIYQRIEDTYDYPSMQPRKPN